MGDTGRQGTRDREKEVWRIFHTPPDRHGLSLLGPLASSLVLGRIAALSAGVEHGSGFGGFWAFRL